MVGNPDSSLHEVSSDPSRTFISICARMMATAAFLLTACTRAPIDSIPTLRASPSAEFELDIPTFEEIRDLEWVADSTFVVVAGDGAKIAVVSAGQPTVFVGRKGSGPGEFRNITSILAWGPSSFVAVDSENRRLLFWNIRGRLLAERDLSDYRLSYGPFRTTAGVVLKVFPSGTKVARLMVIRGSGEQPRVQLDSGGGIGLSCMLCNTSIGPDGSMAFAEDPREYRVQRLDAHGRPIAPIVLEHFALVSRSQYEIDSVKAFRGAQYPRMRASGLSDAGIRDLLATAPIATEKGMFVPAGIHHDDSGDLWLQRSVARGAPSEADVFSPEGVQRGTVLLPPGFTLSRLRGQYILGQQATEEGGTSIVILAKPSFPH